MNPYETLGVEPEASTAKIKKAYIRLSKKCHPDVGGDAEEFRAISEAYELLTDKERRERFDKLGITRLSKVTPERIEIYFRETLANALAVGKHRLMGESQKDRIILGVVGARLEILRRIELSKDRIDCCKIMMDRFRVPEGEDDVIRRCMEKELLQAEEELIKGQDALELSEAVEKIIKSYQYDVGLDPEGQFRPRPTNPVRGLVMSSE